MGRISIIDNDVINIIDIIDSNKLDFQEYFLKGDSEYSISYIDSINSILIVRTWEKNTIIPYDAVFNWNLNLKLIKFVNGKKK